MDQQSPPRHVRIHEPADFEAMRRAGRLAAEVLDFIIPQIVPGATTDEINIACHDYIVANGAYPSPLNYRGFPKSTCTSINHVVCHGIPGDRCLVEGDIMNLDITVTLDGWYGDTSRMFTIGKVKRLAERLIETTFEALWRGIEVVRPGATLGDIGFAIQSHAEAERFSVVRDFCGHGLGEIFHTAPSVLHFGEPGHGMRLEEGMFFTIEPMINAGRPDVKILPDGWTAVTKDRGLSAQFEHSIGVTADGYEVFTLSPAGLDKPPYDDS
ncbi:MAG: type I methionyl aminopeptidase [Alphaproteobacteria bacterium]|nr:type I methionyl aminopeptidase [Alphaproteobacteria bacterium]MCZ6764661.1 type I methionyl aminopeptidase [Alphaproteobacteria bacterium]